MHEVRAVISTVTERLMMSSFSLPFHPAARGNLAYVDIMFDFYTL